MKINPPQCLAAGVAHRHKPVLAAVKNLFFGRYLAKLQRRRAGNNFKRRTRRIFTTDNFIAHRIVRVIINDIPVFFTDAVHKKVRVESRAAYHGTHSTCFRVDSNNCRCPCPRCHPGRTQISQMLIHSFFHAQLQIFIYCKFKAFAWHRVYLPKLLNYIASNVNFFVITAVLAAHITVVSFFQPKLANHTANRHIFVRAFCNIVIAYFANIANGMYRKFFI